MIYESVLDDVKTCWVALVPGVDNLNPLPAWRNLNWNMRLGLWEEYYELETERI